MFLLACLTGDLEGPVIMGLLDVSDVSQKWQAGSILPYKFFQ